MFLVGITVFFVLLGVGFFAYGAIALSKYAFRLGTGPGLLTLLFPPYTFYFALFKLEEEGKSWPTASWLFGLVVAALMVVAFWPDLSAVAQGDFSNFEEAEAAQTAPEKSKEAEAKEKAEKEIAEEKAEEEKAQEEADAGDAGESADGGESEGDAGEAEEADEDEDEEE
ncbi:MAG: hypothetical protein ACLFVJ_11275 [Persicimonas sp.]